MCERSLTSKLQNLLLLRWKVGLRRGSVDQWIHSSRIRTMELLSAGPRGQRQITAGQQQKGASPPTPSSLSSPSSERETTGGPSLPFLGGCFRLPTLRHRPAASDTCCTV